MSILTRFIEECKNDWKNQPKKWVDQAINSNVSKYMYGLEEYAKKQEKKDELLGLYAVLEDSDEFLYQDERIELWDKITELRKELGELK